jgi:hypothetical protein
LAPTKSHFLKEKTQKIDILPMHTSFLVASIGAQLRRATGCLAIYFC